MKKIFLTLVSIFILLVSNSVAAQQDPGGDPNTPTIIKLTSSVSANDIITEGCAGTKLLIRGTKLAGATKVTVNNVPVAKINFNSEYTIDVTLPAGAASGVVEVTTPVDTARSAGNFTIVANSNPGTNGTFAVCAGTTATNAELFAQLGGTPDTGGTWSNVGLVYTYSVSATSPCFASTATVTVTEQAAPNAGTSGTLILTSSPSDEVLFAALTGADAGGSWTRPSSGYVGVYTYTVSATSPCTLSSAATVTVTAATVLPTADTTFNFCTGAKVSALVAATGTGVKAYAAVTGGVALGDVALTGTIAKPVSYYLSEPTVSGESARVRVYVIINALPAKPSALVLTNDNAVAPTTAVTAVGLYAGTNTPFKLTATAVGAVSFKWSLPSGVVRTNSTGTSTDSDATSTDAFIYVKFTGTGSATPLVINVQSVNASGCTSDVKASASLTRLLPAAPSALALNNGVITTAITTFAKYMGSSTVFRLSATASVTATSYLWELPTGVNRMTALEGGSNTLDLTSTEPFIYVNFAGVTKDNTDTNSTVLTTLTKVLRIGVKSVNGVGSSVTANATAANPTTGSTAKLLTLTAVAPAAPASLAMNNGANTTAITVISKMIGQGTTVKLLAPISVLASSYAWQLPACVTRVTSLTDSTVASGTTTDPFIYVKFNGTNPAAGFIYFGVKAVNGVGSSNSSVANAAVVGDYASSEFKLLKLATAVPAAPTALILNDGINATAITVISKLIGQGGTYRLATAVPAATLANSFAWQLPTCVTRVASLTDSTPASGTTTDPYIYVKFNGSTPAAGSINFGVTAVNGVGSSATAKLLTVTAGLPAAVAAVSGSLSVCNRSTGFSYTITAPVGATSYTITAPAGSVVSSTSVPNNTSNVLITSDLTFKVVYSGTAAFATADKSLVIRSANAFGPCLTTKALALTKQANCNSIPTSTIRLAAPSVAEEFNVIAYPNPSSDVFTLEVQSLVKGKATTNVQVYDMTGRLIEQRQAASNSIEIGNGYPTGVYNVIVNQVENTKSLRVIKR